MSGQSKVMSTIIAAIASLLVSTVAVSATVGPVQTAHSSEVARYA